MLDTLNVLPSCFYLSLSLISGDIYHQVGRSSDGRLRPAEALFLSHDSRLERPRRQKKEIIPLGNNCIWVKLRSGVASHSAKPTPGVIYLRPGNDDGERKEEERERE